MDQSALRDFERHLRAERGRSDHTVRAYLGDVRALAEFLEARGVEHWSEVRLTDLRSWLADLDAGGAARSTIARRSATARTFFTWATRTGACEQNPALRLVAPKRAHTLPGVLKQQEAVQLLDIAAVAADDDDPVHARDVAMLELLYASGIRVSELTGLDVDDADLTERVVRVIGKGDKERTVPFGGARRASGREMVAAASRSGRCEQRPRALPRAQGEACRCPAGAHGRASAARPRARCA